MGITDAQRASVPTAVILDRRPLQSTPESGGRAGCDGAEQPKGRKEHAVVDLLGNLLAPKVTATNEQDRAQVGALAQVMRAATGENVEAVKHRVARRGFVLLPRRWVVEGSFAWAARFRRLARDYERLAITLSGCHWLAFAVRLLNSLFAKSA